MVDCMRVSVSISLFDLVSLCVRPRCGGDEVKQSGPSEDDAPHVVIAGSSGMLLVYVIIPTIPLLLLILVASGTCCFQMFSKSKPRTKTSVNHQSTLWISKTPKTDSMEV
ncbi:unnamed protein product [Oncorhynchus mykiss]|uniref:Uncharacterized protein n=1 Tax=Oncorhynchus mykiss TaxID=8022 RepID=A0A060YZ96_ONCMY|nr:unnamed protein product [Oncorhynchus mykiss]